MSSSLRSKIEQLEKKLSISQSPPDVVIEAQPVEVIKSDKKEIPWKMVIGVASPVLIFALLYIIQPKMVKKKEGSQHVRSNTRVFVLTLVLSALVWGGIYLYNRYYNGSS